MTDHIDARERYRRMRSVVAPTHKFDLGSHVAHRAGPGGARSLYRVTRHLPDGGQGLQYRIRSDVDGHERVAVESTLERAGGEI